jgi:hypothetical protein
VTHYVPHEPSRWTRILITVFTVLAPTVVIVAWRFHFDANFDHTFDELPLRAYIPIAFMTTSIGLGVPIVVLVHSLIVNARNRGRRGPFRGIVSGGLSLLVALPMLFDAVPLLIYEIDLGHAPSAEETSVSSSTLLAKAKSFEDETAAQVNEQIIRRDPARTFVCELSNGHDGHGYSVPVRMTAPPTQAAIAGILSYWKSLGYTVEREEFRYSANPAHQLAPALAVTPQVFEITVTTSCVVH